MKVVWTEQALIRLIEIEEFVAADDPAAAIELTAKLIARGQALTKLWRRGRHLPELPSAANLRELMHGNYRLVYRIGVEAIEILTVFEGHRRLPREDLR
jgi:plasmid stabilization system protein ParE